MSPDKQIRSVPQLPGSAPSGIPSDIAILSDVMLSIIPMLFFADFSLFAGTLVMPLPDTLQTVHCLPTSSSTCSASLTILPADERVGTETQIFVPHVADRTTTFVEPFLQMGLSNMNQEVELLSKLSAAASQPAAKSFVNRRESLFTVDRFLRRPVPPRWRQSFRRMNASDFPPWEQYRRYMRRQCQFVRPNFVNRRESLFADRRRDNPSVFRPADEHVGFPAVGTISPINPETVSHVANRTTTFVEPFLQMGLSNMNQEMELLSKFRSCQRQRSRSSHLHVRHQLKSLKIGCHCAVFHLFGDCFTHIFAKPSSDIGNLFFGCHAVAFCHIVSAAHPLKLIWSRPVENSVHFSPCIAPPFPNRTLTKNGVFFGCQTD
ncbi:hypothetical protein niasHS_012745 [Heterodera schachtii]|uniref:Uncharacterized protein n=1 Tax=Heterodera schachtii TaxID=97005 RepID=A0ABD2IP83_HETSC